MSILSIYNHKHTKRAWKSLVGFMCEYEVIALLSKGKIPTWTQLTKRFPFIAPTVLAGLFAHFYLEERWVSTTKKRS
jgi:hypothetical protein